MESQWVHNGHGDRNHSLRLQVHDFDERGAFLLHFDMNCDVFGERQQDDMIDHFVRMLDAFIDDRSASIGGINLLSKQEHDGVVVAYNQSESQYPDEQTVVDYFQSQASKTPSNIAVCQGDKSLTYAELDERSNRLANYLNSIGVSGGDYVGIHMSRSIDVVVSMLGVLKSGAAYVPMDLLYTKQRVGFVLEDTRAKVVLTQGELSEGIDYAGIEVVCVDSDWSDIAGCSVEAPSMEPSPDDTAYVIYTSGSTGIPKGVMVAHKSLANYVWWARKSYVGGEDLDFPLFSSISFDLTVTSIYVPLISGNRIVVYPEDGDKADMAFMHVIEDDRVGVIKLTPSHLSLLSYVDKRPKKLRKLILGGEDLKCSLAGSVVDMFSQRIEIYNEYGPTEATVGCMIHRFDQGLDVQGSVAIGKPTDNMRIYVLDRHMNPTAIGIEGEMYIGGVGVAQGYLNRQELNEYSFVDDPFREGEKIYRTGDIARWVTPQRLVYVGRKDGQVKIRGARIELGEIESAMQSHEAITGCVVDVIDTGARGEGLEKITHCVRCGLPSNFPRLTMAGNGLCSICQEYDAYREQAGMYFKTMADLRESLDRAKQRKEGEYDCMMLLSGGKDSTFALYQVAEMGYRPLVFSLDNGYISDGAKANIKRAVEGLGLELVWGRTEAMNEIFADSLARHSNVCQGCFKTIYTLSTNIAKQRGIKAIVTGLSRGQVFETRVADLFHDKVFDPESIDQTIIDARKAYHRMDDAVSRCLDVEIFKDDTVYHDIEFVDFYRYCDVELDEMLSFLSERAPWVRPSDTGRSTNCLINEAGIYVHKKERGYHNYALPYSWDVRLGHKQRDAALEELDDQIDEDNVNRILKEVGYTPVNRGSHEPSKQLIGYYVADRQVAGSQVREYLASQLTDQMVPTKLIQVESIPLNDRGKVDRNALAELVANSAEADTVYMAARNETEQKLVEIWQQALQVDRVGIDDNFFDLGGDSIINIQIIARANQAGILLTPNQLFENPTVATLAEVAGVSSSPSQDTDKLKEDVPLGPMTNWALDQNELSKISKLLNDTDE